MREAECRLLELDKLVVHSIFCPIEAMPVYDYECADCGTFEANRRIAERDEPAACPRCGETSARVTIGAPSLGRGGNGGANVSEDSGSYGMRHRGGCACCG